MNKLIKLSLHDEVSSSHTAAQSGNHLPVMEQVKERKLSNESKICTKYLRYKSLKTHCFHRYITVLMASVYQCLPEAQIYTLVAPHLPMGVTCRREFLSLHLSPILVWEPKGVCGSCQRLVWSGLVADKHRYYGHLRYHPLKFPSLLRARW